MLAKYFNKQARNNTRSIWLDNKDLLALTKISLSKQLNHTKWQLHPRFQNVTTSMKKHNYLLMCLFFGKGSYQKYNPHKISFLMIYYMTIFRKKYFCTYLNLTP